MLNLGCGLRWHPAWSNIDIVSTGAGVLQHDLRRGIPCPAASYDVVYHSHVLEHLARRTVAPFMRECYRVLRPGGVLRVAVPDLERIVRTYLTALDLASHGSPEWTANYEWILLEMYDQAVREDSGGEMAAYLARIPVPNAEFVIQRLGVEAENLIDAGRRQAAAAAPASARRGRWRRLFRELPRPRSLREWWLRLLLGEEYESLEIGRFRRSGEVHHWMYDRHSLARLLDSAGFGQVLVRTATDSYVPDWAGFNLDTEPDGTVYKPDSLYMEGVKEP